MKSRTNLVRISEKEFIRQVMLAAHHNGWVVAHFGSAKTVGGRWITPIQGHAKGFPDLVMIHRKTGRLLAVELKVGRNQASKEQLDWLDLFCLGGHYAAVWRPEDWETIHRVLKGAVE